MKSISTPNGAIIRLIQTTYLKMTDNVGNLKMTDIRSWTFKLKHHFFFFMFLADYKAYNTSYLYCP